MSSVGVEFACVQRDLYQPTQRVEKYTACAADVGSRPLDVQQHYLVRGHDNAAGTRSADGVVVNDIAHGPHKGVRPSRRTFSAASTLTLFSDSARHRCHQNMFTQFCLGRRGNGAAAIG